MKKVEELVLEEGFGGLAKTATPTYNPDGSVNRYIDTYQFTKKQAIAVGARLNNQMLMKVINRLEDERAKLDLGRQGEAWTPPHTTPLKMRTTLSLLKIE